MIEPCTRRMRDLFLLRDDVTFLNHGSFGACPRPVFDAWQALQRELEAEPVDFLAFERSLPERLGRVRARLARFLGADPDEIVLVPNATTGLNIAARSLDLSPGDRILATDHEYGAMDRMWRYLCGRSGAEYVRVELDPPLEDPAAVVETVRRNLDEKTKVLFLSHITSPSGVRLPIEPLIRAARERGVLTMIDGAHGPGQLDIDLHAMGADIYSGNCHKWLMAPKGNAILYVRRELQPRIDPLVLGWGWEAEEPGLAPFIDHQERTGTRDMSGPLAVDAALDFFEAHRWRRVRAACRTLLLEARERLLGVIGLEPLCPPDPWLLQMCALPLPASVDGPELHRRLRETHAVEVPVTAFSGRHWLRISIQGYNTVADIDRLQEALEIELRNMNKTSNKSHID